MQLQLTDLEKKLLVLLKKRGEMRYTEIHSEIGISSAGLTKLLNRMVEKGLILRKMKGEKYPPPVYYSINSEKISEIIPVLKEEAEESYQALMEFDPEEAKRILDELLEKIKRK